MCPWGRFGSPLYKAKISNWSALHSVWPGRGKMITRGCPSGGLACLAMSRGAEGVTSARNSTIAIETLTHILRSQVRKTLTQQFGSALPSGDKNLPPSHMITAQWLFLASPRTGSNVSPQPCPPFKDCLSSVA